ncbi:hypothetical protein SDJN03_01649, partial [Cucurbita argyrosperma subsp. sororia]
MIVKFSYALVKFELNSPFLKNLRDEYEYVETVGRVNQKQKSEREIVHIDSGEELRDAIGKRVEYKTRSKVNKVEIQPCSSLLHLPLPENRAIPENLPLPENRAIAIYTPTN